MHNQHMHPHSVHTHIVFTRTCARVHIRGSSQVLSHVKCVLCGGSCISLDKKPHDRQAEKWQSCETPVRDSWRRHDSHESLHTCTYILYQLKIRKSLLFLITTVCIYVDLQSNIPFWEPIPSHCQFHVQLWLVLSNSTVSKLLYMNSQHSNQGLSCHVLSFNSTGQKCVVNTMQFFRNILL